LTHPLTFDAYKQKFDAIIEKIRAGETYIVNLTQPTPIECSLSLKEIFHIANARYKLLVRDEFVCFSPESFVEITADNTIHTFPMKGTIDASIKDAKERILADPKEMAEHIMVVDLLRNDLSMVASNVRVKQLRYVEKIAAGERELLQVSSHISGDLQPSWRAHLGDILKQLIPAGSISGTPKRSTLAIIDEVEGYERGFFTGIFGCFDGSTLKSAVMIRFIEKHNGRYIYKSGGGITIESDAMREYKELLEKIYI